MRKIYSFICTVCLILMIPLILRVRGTLPLDPQLLIEEKYGDWAGVLRLWICEGWPAGAGTVAGWLNRCIASFEKRHPGVFVQPEYVSEADMAALGTDNLLPDMALFPPGAIRSPDILTPLDLDAPLRPALRECGRAAGALIAVPVLAGGYAWACRADLPEDLPGSWRGSGVTMACPSDEPCRMWTAALLGLCSGRVSTGAPEAAEFAPGGVDLGLPPERVATPAPTPAPETVTQDCLLPEGFAPGGDAWRAFINGEASVMPVTQREVRLLEALTDQGRGVEWRLATAGNALIDQLLLLGVVNREGPDARRALCEAFAEHLLSDECQGRLADAGAFSVTDAPSGYGAGDALASMEAFLRAGTPIVRPAFGDFPRQAQSIVRDFLEERAAPAALWRRLGGVEDEKSEHSS